MSERQDEAKAALWSGLPVDEALLVGIDNYTDMGLVGIQAGLLRKAAYAIATLTARAEAAEAKLAKAVEALRPFAKMGEACRSVDGTFDPDDPLAKFIRARAVLDELDADPAKVDACPPSTPSKAPASPTSAPPADAGT